ncbi:hypothetical protein C8F04DRAFT_1188755 [Mycena alexandri]|uniref:Alpha-type protein kinase domain-containing protein n=1 Tax=Mycena alexandri TaxID=1745969 RepID=A0AAD6SIH9_9AGAR|nr:hypothetical protein C8F04DRAFT_1188755 [Mycena alexandri]
MDFFPISSFNRVCGLRLPALVAAMLPHIPRAAHSKKTKSYGHPSDNHHKGSPAPELSRGPALPPQIMTAPSIGEGVEIWGEGNVPAAFNAFPEQHVCNKFCTWFQLPSALATAG